MNAPNFVVRLDSTLGYWLVFKDGTLFSSHATMQNAISAAKIHATRELGSVIWHDRKGNVQGQCSYRPSVAVPPPEETTE